ncbi:hypothetical protein NDU88_001194 [Pleurodeles waltl]|uniref:Uncharacterized protein n=1 Tax=Pleurodeles waltl TaxID=8319 RepID=A0AAV7UTC6_PLEWA|nr:hypothetical protein NDU88_001194 [Pleurodeles waltl]
MGNHDRSQLPFEKKKPSQPACVYVGEDSPDGDPIWASLEMDVKALLPEVRHRLFTFNPKIDTLTNKLNQMSNKLEKSEGHLDELNLRASDSVPHLPTAAYPAPSTLTLPFSRTIIMQLYSSMCFLDPVFEAKKNKDWQ